MVERYGFDEFATTRAKRLFQYAYLVGGDWHQAEDLVQTTLGKLDVAWRRIERQENVDAYARRVLLRTYLSQRRLKRTGETPVAEPAAGATNDGDADLRVTLQQALRALPARHRAVIVPRYFDGQPIESAAGILGLTVPAVKSINSRALAAMRGVLGAAREDLFKH